jgi:hypothetical protein
LTTAFRTSGSHVVTAVFDGTATFAPSRALAIHEIVSPTTTTTTLTASANPAPVGKPLTLKVAVTPAFTGAGAPTGTVILSDNGVTLSFASLDSSGQAVFTFIPGQVIGSGPTALTILPRGTHSLKVTFSGDGNFDASVSATLVLTVV